MPHRFSGCLICKIIRTWLPSRRMTGKTVAHTSVMGVQELTQCFCRYHLTFQKRDPYSEDVSSCVYRFVCHIRCGLREHSLRRSCNMRSYWEATTNELNASPVSWNLQRSLRRSNSLLVFFKTINIQVYNCNLDISVSTHLQNAW